MLHSISYCIFCQPKVPFIVFHMSVRNPEIPILCHQYIDASKLNYYSSLLNFNLLVQYSVLLRLFSALLLSGPLASPKWPVSFLLCCQVYCRQLLNIYWLNEKGNTPHWSVAGHWHVGGTLQSREIDRNPDGLVVLILQHWANPPLYFNFCEEVCFFIIYVSWQCYCYFQLRCP